MASNNDSLMTKTAKATGWMVVWRAATRTLGLFSTLILVRFLAPGDFGLVALGTGFAQAIEALSIIGVDDALIREKTLDSELYNTAFTMNAIRNFGTAIIILAASIPVARFFNEPRLAHILMALAVATAFQAFENVGIIDFRRNLTFDMELKLRLAPRLAGILTTITLAIIFHSYWALVSGILVGKIAVVAMGYVLHSYRPRFTLSAWRRIIGFSVWTWFITMAALIKDRSSTFIIGRLLNPTMVGLFSVSIEIAILPYSEFVQPLCRACFSTFAIAKHSNENIAETYLRVIRSVTLITLPASVGIALTAEPIVRIALGEKWMEAAPLIQIVVIGTLFAVFGSISSTLFSSHGLLSEMFRIQVATIILGVPLFAFMVAEYGLVIATLCSISIGLLENGYYIVMTARKYHIPFRDMAATSIRPLIAAATMAVVVRALHMGHATAADKPSELFLPLLATVAIGAAVYIATLTASWTVAGRPDGAEKDFLAVAKSAYNRFAPRRVSLSVSR